MIKLKSNFKLKILLLSVILADFIWSSLSIPAPSASVIAYQWPLSKLELTKQNWLNKANIGVENEINKLLAAHGLTTSDVISHPFAIEFLKLILSFKCKSEIRTIKKRFNCCNLPSNVTSGNSETEIQKLADNIFVNSVCSHVEIVDFSNYPTVGVCGVSKDYSSNVCYIYLDKVFFAKNLFQLDAVLRHEYAHISNADALTDILLALTIALYSNKLSGGEPPELIAKELHLLMQAYETRADIYAAVNSSDHGASLIEYLKIRQKKATRSVAGAVNCKDYLASMIKQRKDGQKTMLNSDIGTHPSSSSRIKLLKQVKAALDAAAKK